MGKIVFSEAEKRLAVELKEEGYSYEAIASAFSRNTRVITALIKGTPSKDRYVQTWEGENCASCHRPVKGRVCIQCRAAHWARVNNLEKSP